MACAPLRVPGSSRASSPNWASRSTSPPGWRLVGVRVASFKEGFLPFAMIIGLVAGLIVLEKSVSMTIIVLAIGLSIYFVGGGAFKQFVLLVAIGAPVLLFAIWQFGYPIDRMKGWYDVWFNPSQAPQDLLKLSWLLREGGGIGVDPATWQLKAMVFGLWSDFLFANIGADFKIVGMLAVVALYCWFGYRAIGICPECADALRCTAGRGSDHLDSGASGNSHCGFALDHSRNGSTVTVYVVWRLVARVMHGCCRFAAEHLTLGQGEEGAACVFCFPVGGLAATSIPSWR